LTHHERYNATYRITIIGVIVNLILSFIKIIFGWLGQSHALIADGIHSLSDLASDAIVIFGAKTANQVADKDHPYGHGRIETIATVAMSILLIMVASKIIFDAIQHLMNPTLLLKSGILALITVIISIIAKLILYYQTITVAKNINSSLLHANAWHHLSDSFSSIIVLISIIGSMFGILWLDAIGAIGVGLMIFYIGIILAWNSIKELIDTGLDQEKIKQIEYLILKINEVKSLHDLRTRSMGGNVLVDVHILVENNISVSEGHKIADAVRIKLTTKMPEIMDVLVHIDIENDNVSILSTDLPLRTEVVNNLFKCWQSHQIAQQIKSQNIVLHYINGKVNIDINLSLNNLQNTKLITVELINLIKQKNYQYIGRINIFYKS
jgi:cation diffusion facilitator family transporter